MKALLNIVLTLVMCGSLAGTLKAQNPTVDTISALRSYGIPSTDNYEITLLGYYTKADKAPRTYRWAGTASDADDGGSVIAPTDPTNPPQPISSGRWFLVHSDSVFNVVDFGAVGDNSSDNTMIIQSAINAADKAGGGTVVFPTGTFRFSSTLTLGVSNVGDNAYGSSKISLQGQSAITSILRYTGSGVAIMFNSVKYAKVSELLIDNAGTPGATEGVQLAGAHVGTATQLVLFEQVSVNHFHYGIHASNNPVGVRSGSTSSELRFDTIEVTNCDFGVYTDDFNTYNLTFTNADFGSNGVGIFAAMGVNILSGSGEYNGVDIDSRTGSVSPSLISNWRSEHAGLFARLSGAHKVSEVYVTALNPSLKPSDDFLFFSSAEFPPGTIVSIDYIPGGAGQSALSIENSILLGPVMIAYPDTDVMVTNTTVAWQDVITPRWDISFTPPINYWITNCRTTTPDYTSSSRYPDRVGTYFLATWQDVYTRNGADNLALRLASATLLPATLPATGTPGQLWSDGHHFYGWIDQGTGTYAWYQLDN